MLIKSFKVSVSFNDEKCNGLHVCCLSYKSFKGEIFIVANFSSAFNTLNTLLFYWKLYHNYEILLGGVGRKKPWRNRRGRL